MIPIQWDELIDVIKRTTLFADRGEFAQPIKPYLRYRDMKNRIIAMPAFVGGDINKAGIKWIASFPGNLSNGLPRAHSVTILNDADTGKPVAIINTAMISGIRTASVSGLVIDKFRQRDFKRIGICGFGIIGRMHLDMVSAMLGNDIDSITLYDVRPIDLKDIPSGIRDKIVIADDWRYAYANADLFITATVSGERYIDLPPLKGSLQLNVSLRDYNPQIRKFMDIILVDKWDEVCRENTDIEAMFKASLLQPSDTSSIADLVCDRLPDVANDQTVMFNPMGMAIYDVGIANHYYRYALNNEVGTVLED